MLALWGIFGLSALAVVIAGYKLGQYGDEIAEATGIERAWIGMLLLATVTSLPELATTVTAGAIVAPQIALGNIFGSNLFNMALLFVMEAVSFWILGQRDLPPLLANVGYGQLRYASVAISLTALAVVGIGLGSGGEFLGMGPVSWAILVVYPLGVWALYRPRDPGAGLPPRPRDAVVPLLKFAAAAAVVIVAGMYLARTGKGIALRTRLTGTFMGAIFIAASTSLPELMSCIGALRIRSFDLLVGNLFGSNMFNIFTIPFADLAYRGSLLPAGSREQMVVAALSVVLMSIAAFGIERRSRRRFLGIGPEAWGILLVYLVAVYVLFRRGIEF
ncbi:MAG: hypothetical protein GXO72_04275 [Caldiserica bacterium]|nr:hypothetical protein [Caldisericota bacterium]